MELNTPRESNPEGNLPAGWAVVPLAYFNCEVIDCHHSTPTWTSSGEIVIRNQNIKNGKLGITEPSYTTESHYLERIRRAKPTASDLILTREAPIGEVCMIPPELKCCLGQRMVLLRMEHATINSVYLLYALQSEKVQRHIFISGGTGSTVSNLRIPLIKALPIFFPLEEQEQLSVATALSDVDALIAGLEKLIAKKRDTKQAAMQQLLTGKTRLPGFSGEWFRNDLKNLVSTPITDGPHLTPTFHETGVPFLSVNNLADNRIDLTDLRFISKADDEIFSRKCKPRKGDLLLGKAASVGKVAIIEDDSDFNIWSPIALIRSDEQVYAKFLYYQLLSADCIKQVMLLTNSSSQGNIGMGDIERIQISYPCLEEQTAIATVLADMDTDLTVLNARLAKSRDLKQGMMQELLTGKTRLI